MTSYQQKRRGRRPPLRTPPERLRRPQRSLPIEDVDDDEMQWQQQCGVGVVVPTAVGQNIAVTQQIG